MQVVQTAEGPRVACSPRAMLVLANTARQDIIRQAARAWLTDYHGRRVQGVADLQARTAAADAFDSALAALSMEA